MIRPLLGKRALAVTEQGKGGENLGWNGREELDTRVGGMVAQNQIKTSSRRQDILEPRLQVPEACSIVPLDHLTKHIHDESNKSKMTTTEH